MSRIFKLLLAGLILTVIQPLAHSQDDVSADLKIAIERDSAIPDLEWRSLNARKSAIDPRKLSGHTLTYMFLSLRTPEIKNMAVTEEFEVFESVKVWNIFDEIERGKGPYTFVHADRINDIDCKVEGDEAVGTFWFLVPKLYQGRIDYRAKMTDSKWSITEFILPAHEIHLIRDGDSWTKKK